MDKDHSYIFQGKGDVLTYWLIREDRMKRLSRIESYMSEKQSPTSPVNNNIDCTSCDNEVKCDTQCEYSVPPGFSSDSEAKTNRPPLQRQEHSDQMSINSEGYENCTLDKRNVQLNSVVPLEKGAQVDSEQRKYENHIEMTPLLSER